MSVLHYTQQRIDAVLEEIGRLKHSEFAYPDSSDALDHAEELFRQQRSSITLLQSIENPPDDLIMTECSIALNHLYEYLPILGFVLRSTNVRNAFETHGPLLRLASSLLGPSASLILSSEWEFSPYTFRPIAALSGFVLIGLPATESANPLLIPLSGHELGHSVWQLESLNSAYSEPIRVHILDQIKDQRWSEYQAFFPGYRKDDLETNFLATQTWAPACDWASLQLEEILCDMLGIRLFAESYLHAFAYLVSPGMSGQRSVAYPTSRKRASYQHKGAQAFGVDISPEYCSFFADEDKPADPTKTFLVSLADSASHALVDSVVARVGQYAAQKNAPVRMPEEVRRICMDFRRLVPSRGPCTLCDIINAGWHCFFEKDLWAAFPNIESDKRVGILKELILKSIEITEINALAGDPQ